MRHPFYPGDRVEVPDDAYFTFGGERLPVQERLRGTGTVLIGTPDEDGDILVRCEAGTDRVNPDCLTLIERGGVRTRPHDEEDMVNHPSHYTAYPGVEVIELTEHMSFCRGNAVKYIARAGLKSKDTEMQDLRKALWYIEREIARLEALDG